MRYAVQANEGSYADFLEWATFAESSGLDAFAIPDHYLRGHEGALSPALDSLAVMAGLARDTQSIELVLLVSPVTWRHPAVLAKTAATLAEMSDGRVTLGVGTGWWELEHTLFGIPFPPVGERFTLLEETLGYLRAAFSEPPVDFSGDHYTFTAFDMQPRPELRLLVGGGGHHRTPRLAGAYADEFNAYPAPYADFEAKVERARKAADANGRDPAALKISTAGFLIASDSEETRAEQLEAVAERVGRSPQQMADVLEARNAPRGSWDEVRASMAAYAERGVSRFYLQAFADDIASMEEKLSHLM